MKKILVVMIIVIALVVATTSVAFAAEGRGAVQGYNGNGSANTENAGSYCAQLEPEELEQFKADRLEQYKERLDAAIASGAITQEQADEYYAAKKAAMDSCDGSGDCDAQGIGRIGGNNANGTCTGTGYGNGGGRGCGMIS